MENLSYNVLLFRILNGQLFMDFDTVRGFGNQCFLIVKFFVMIYIYIFNLFKSLTL
jgi:hypothetical protein